LGENPEKKKTRFSIRENYQNRGGKAKGRQGSGGKLEDLTITSLERSKSTPTSGGGAGESYFKKKTFSGKIRGTGKVATENLRFQEQRKGNGGNSFGGTPYATVFHLWRGVL